ncbi:uncharacterized protein [Trachinotus anak]|uniref:uncharacterized protein isoform X1 n=1 Tax=Trachinotus anak TaxID=443729 RepID=UPI0039F2240A
MFRGKLQNGISLSSTSHASSGRSAEGSERLNESSVGRVMNDRGKHRAECAADGGMYVQRRSCPSRPVHQSTTFTLLPPRPRSYGDTRLPSRGSGSLGLQVQGFCCPLQQRPTSGRVTPLSRGGGVGRPILLSSLKGRLESRAKPASRTRTGSRPKVGGLTVGHHGDPVSETAETPTTPCDSERRAPHGQPGSAKTSELHLYLPSSSHCEDEDSETEEMRAPYRPSVEKTSDVKSNDTVFPNPSLTSREQTSTAPGTPVSPSDDITLEDSEHKSLNCQ